MTALTSAVQYLLTFEHRPEYLYAHVTGQHDSYEISRNYWQEISQELKNTGYTSVLVDEDIVESASMSDVFQLVSEFNEMGFGGIKIAFFDRQIEHADLNDFGALAASNRGVNGQAFNDIEKATAWLLSEDK